MDIATIIGVISGIVLILWAIITKGSLLTFWDFSSLLIVVGGVMSATLIHFSLDQVLGVMKVLKNAFKQHDFEPTLLINRIVRMAEKARREGLLSLDYEIDQESDPFLVKGVQMVVDGTDPDVVRRVMETDIIMIEERHRIGASIFTFMGASAPAFGMLGTLIGLILMLKDINDPGKLGPGMALALITTFYGALLGNLVCLPIAGKLKLRSKEEVLLKDIIIEGVLAIQAGENPRIIEEKLKSYLYPKQKALLEENKRLEIEERRRGFSHE
ncbi:MAG TPA: MotA/TolQ/ExbB proton channel family protein [Peptococcaceae bacterium]|jgi:chemotaxis protein MotA|nr:MotA/TolQ/ExbB proton channel family protein [Peptococcaceae bacterium]HPZ70592.1 MotA/TolQ/ExbB proton channel family protein [Peptococcaceae bacterium]HQD53403.1 MotA/TolQ/ExbB proton channel family protein [Peptococcaceae bacterium]